MRKIKVLFLNGTSEDFNHHDWRMDFKINIDWVEIYAINGLKENIKIAAFNREAVIGIKGY